MKNDFTSAILGEFSHYSSNTCKKHLKVMGGFKGENAILPLKKQARIDENLPGFRPPGMNVPICSRQIGQFARSENKGRSGGEFSPGAPGFTLLEVMITLGIIAIIAVIAIPTYQNYTRKAHYAEIVQAAAPFKLAVTECFHILGTLVDCNTGSHGISNTPLHSNIQSIVVNAGQIIIIPEDRNGLKPEDTYILTPKVENDFLTWKRSGGGIAAGYTR